MEHQFTPKIMSLLKDEFGANAPAIFSASPLLNYLNIKTKSVSRGSKARSSFGNLYALYVLVEDYVRGGFDRSGKYKNYEGARFTPLFRRQQELPFGAKLQNHHLNTRLNDEFKQKFPAAGAEPIVRDDQSGLYWINERLLIVDLGSQKVNIALVILKIVDAYATAKRASFETFIASCEKLQQIEKNNPSEVLEFVQSLLLPNVDARIFEIVSYPTFPFCWTVRGSGSGWRGCGGGGRNRLGP
jgi:hypothetical protein